MSTQFDKPIPSHLATTTEKPLTVSRGDDGNGDNRGEACEQATTKGLLKLPHEILLQIFELINDNMKRPTSAWYSGDLRSPSPLYSLSCVCKRLNTIVESLMYRNLWVNFSGMTTMNPNLAHLTPAPFDRLLWAFEGRSQRHIEGVPERYTFIKDLKLQAAGYNVTLPGQPALERLLSLLNKSHNINTVDLHCDSYLLKIWAVTNALKRHNVSTLRTDSVSTEILTAKNGAFSNLKTLYLEDFDDTPSAHRDSDKESRNSGQTYHLPKDRCGLGSLETLEVKTEENPVNIYPILWWTNRLEYLDMSFVAYDNSTLKDFSVNEMQWLLDTNSSTLKEIRLMSYGKQNPLPDFRRFTSLETLKVSHLNLLNTPFMKAAKKLSIPGLINLAVDYELEDDFDLWANFLEEHRTWFEGFAKEHVRLMEDDHLLEIFLMNVSRYGPGDKELKKAMRSLETLQIELTFSDAERDQKLYSDDLYSSEEESDGDDNDNDNDDDSRE